jgi:hypothetical protein
VDVVASQIKKHQEKLAPAHGFKLMVVCAPLTTGCQRRKFAVADITTPDFVMPDGYDLVFCRDALQVRVCLMSRHQHLP